MLPLWIFTEGDNLRGLGHLSRCSAYATAWHLRGGNVFWVVDGDISAQQFIHEEKCEWRKWQNAPEEITPINGFAIIDSYSATLPVLKKIADSYIRVVYIDDTFRMPYPQGLVIHSITEVCPYTSDMTEWLMGVKWHPLRKAFWSIPKRMEIKSNIEKILILMGGTDLRDLSFKLVELATIVYPKAEINLVYGKVNHNEYKGRHKIYTNLNDIQMANLMCQCDLAISAAGQSTYELAVCGLPAVLICIIDNQERQFNWWKQNDIFPDGIWWNDINFNKKILSSLKKMASPSYRLIRAIKAQQSIDSQGVSRLLDKLSGA